MACTQQSAVQFVQRAQSGLVDSLQSLHVIVERLQDSGVFSAEDVRVVESCQERREKARKILDCVTKKGELAAYELLKILYSTRETTFPQPSSSSSQQAHGLPATQPEHEIDLHYWISSFSFSEDFQPPSVYPAGSSSCPRYQKALRLKVKEVVKDQWKNSRTFFPEGDRGTDFTYIPLELQADCSAVFKSKKYKKNRRKKLKAYVSPDKRKVDPGDLLKTNEDKILLVGRPGIGKTAAVLQVLRLWAEREDQDLSYLFYYDVQTLTHVSRPISLRTLLFNMYWTPGEGADEVFQDIVENSDNVIIIFDGITDNMLSSVPVTSASAEVDICSLVSSVVKKELLPFAKVVVTCRPEAEYLLTDVLDWPSYRVEVLGFSERSVCDYLTMMLGRTRAEEAHSVLENLQLLSLCHVPVYALIVSACISFRSCESDTQPSTVTEMYLHIFRHCLERHGERQRRGTLGRHLDKYIRENRQSIMDLAEVSLNRLLHRSVNFTDLDLDESGVECAFLRSVEVKDSPTSVQTVFTFLHNTVQEFWAALWLLETPYSISEILRLCRTEERKHLKYVVMFLCGLLSRRNARLVKCLIAEDKIQEICARCLEEVFSTFLCPGAEESEDPLDLVFVCQCLLESQSAEACLHLLKELNHSFELSELQLDPHQCCSVSYVIQQADGQKVDLNLEDCAVSQTGLRLILSCLHKVSSLRSSSLLCELWRAALYSGQQSQVTSLLRLCENEIQLTAGQQGSRNVLELFERAGQVIQQRQTEERIKLALQWGPHTVQHSQIIGATILKCLPHICTLRFCPSDAKEQNTEDWKRKVISFLLDLCVQGAERETQTGEKVLETLLSVLSFHHFISQCDFLLDLYSRVKVYESQTGRNVLQALQPVFQSAPAVWTIDLSERKASLFLEVLKLHTVRKPVELKGWSAKEREVRSFLQCLPYISQLSLSPLYSKEGPSEESKYTDTSFLLDLCLQVAECERWTGDRLVVKLLSVFSFPQFSNPVCHCNFLLDLYSQVKDYESLTGRNVLPALQPVFQSAPAVWAIDLSERKASLFLEVLKLHTVRKPVELKGWSAEESEVRSFLQCLPYISQLRLKPEGSVPQGPGALSIKSDDSMDRPVFFRQGASGPDPRSDYCFLSWV
ncbi:nucleotide-binding oligomerization domain-containing protein 2-like [Lepisosteus oculatus]|uniref:nucleotide-binding oligomerization domain-containing protein 2-like n=1 Tax=Lepisosteus oculatus TaxID=7918 RepID=UPI0035F52690